MCDPGPSRRGRIPQQSGAATSPRSASSVVRTTLCAPASLCHHTRSERFLDGTLTLFDVQSFGACHIFGLVVTLSDDACK